MRRWSVLISTAAILLAAVVVIYWRMEAACPRSDAAAYIGLDGNVYLLEVCANKITQLTTDGEPEMPGISEAAGPYSFWDNQSPWSPDRTSLVVYRHGNAYLLDIHTRQHRLLAEAIQRLLWSPDGKHLLVVRFGSNYYVNHQQLSILKVDTGAIQMLWLGSGSVWLDNTHVAYFVAGEESDDAWHDIHQDLYVRSLDGQIDKLPVHVISGSSEPVRISLRSPEGQFLAIHSGGQFDDLDVIDLQAAGSYTMRWSTVTAHMSGYPYYGNYQWSPSGDWLAVCTPYSMADGPPRENYDGSLLLIKGTDLQHSFTDRRCNGMSTVSWHPEGTLVGYTTLEPPDDIWNGEPVIGLLELASGANWSVKLHPTPSDEVLSLTGPWWSGSGNFISVLVDGKLCIGIAPIVGQSEVDFDCPAEATEVSWRPAP